MFIVTDSLQVQYKTPLNLIGEIIELLLDISHMSAWLISNHLLILEKEFIWK